MNENLEELFIKYCIEHNLSFAIKFKEPYFKEYNLDMSAEHPNKDDDIVRHSFEKRRV